MNVDKIGRRTCSEKSVRRYHALNKQVKCKIKVRHAIIIPYTVNTNHDRKGIDKFNLHAFRVCNKIREKGC